MDAFRVLIHVLLVLCLLGIGLTIAANDWHGERRWKIGVVLVLIGYCAVTGLR